MTTHALHTSSPNLWQSLVSRNLEEIMSKIQKDNPEWLTDTFHEPLRFLPTTPLNRELIDRWLQSESHRSQVAEICRKDLKDVTKECVEVFGAFVCLKMEKPSRILKSVPDKTLIIIALDRLHVANGMFYGVDLASGKCIVVSGDKPQYFSGGRKGGGVGIVLRMNFKSA